MPKAGDTVFRMFAGVVEMPLVVSSVTADRIVCGAWQFDQRTGAEVDDGLDWGPPPKRTGSFLRRRDGEIEVK